MAEIHDLTEAWDGHSLAEVEAFVKGTMQTLVSKIGDLANLDTEAKENLVNAVNEVNNKPIATDECPKVFELLAEPTSDMTTLEELATTGITKQVIQDMTEGKYLFCKIRGICYSIMMVSSNELLFGYNVLGSNVDTMTSYYICLCSNNIVEIKTYDV